jgi:signal transduction histidine kinase
MGFSNILLKTENRALSQKSKHFLSRIKENALIMDQLLNTLLVYAKINYSKFDYHAIDLNDVLNAVLVQMRDEISQSQTKFQINRLPVIEGDEIQVKQLFTNLIGNSLKYRSEDRDLVIQIESKKTDHSWDITFADNGIGISEESRESIFQIFRRDTSRKKVGGSGLGLAICKKITELHHGQIWVDPKYQNGTKIHVILPEKSE